MPIKEHFKMASEKEKTEAVARLIKSSTGDFDFYFFLLLGLLMAALGLFLDTPEVIIGGMLIAPMLYPLLSLSLAIVLTDGKLMFRSTRTLVITFFISVAISFILTLLMDNAFVELTFGEQIAARAKPSILFFIVAFVSGLAATYSMVHTSLNEMLPGVAISVSLVPPLAVIGIGLGSGEMSYAWGSFMLFILNAVGIALASMITFTLMNIHSTRKIAQSAVLQEEKRLAEESKKIDEIKLQEFKDKYENNKAI